MLADSQPVYSGRSRLAAIDLVRGAVMILMAIDHVRVYSGLPAGGPHPAIFFTRWITHFCAPAFVFLAGTSAFLRGRRHAGLSKFLLVRGLWLLVLELTFLRWAWTFNFDFAFQMAGVIWVIGWCMILLAGLVRLPVAAIAAIGLAMIGAHDVVDPHLGTLVPQLAASPLSGLWKILYLAFYAGPIHLGAQGPTLVVLYTIIPWVGVMATGYAFGRVVLMEPVRRRHVCLWIGLGAVALFLVLRGFDLYGDPRPWRGQVEQGMRPLLAFLNTNKYPASLLFLLMTLGPAIALVPLLESAHGRVTRWVETFGRVPFFYYMLHIPLVHALALVVSKLRLGVVDPWLFTNHPMGNPRPPEGSTWSIGLLYLVWAIAIVILSFACRWFAGLKARRHDWWLSYL